MRFSFKRLVLVFASLSSLAAATWAESVRVSAGTLNLRRDPRMGAGVVATLKRGDVLEVVERAGEWYRVKTSSGLIGYVSARWVEPWMEPLAGAPHSPDTPPTPADPAFAAGGVGITHDGVGCVVAGRYPQLEACFTPAEAVGRARILFRADGRSPWYSVAMHGEGACQSAVLPKPRATLTAFQYFIEVVDRSFVTIQNPEQALDRPYTPRVVAADGDCDRGRLLASGLPSASVLVSVALDATGKVLETAVPALAGGPASLGAGFSLDGVTLQGAGTVTASSSATTATKGKTSGGAGHGTKLLAIGGGVVAAGALAAAGAGGGDSASSSSTAATAGGGSGSGASTLSGHWAGTGANGGGLALTISDGGSSCSFGWDLIFDLTQSGGSLAGTGTTVARALSCSADIPIPGSLFVGRGTGPVSGSTSGTAVSLSAGTMTFVGNASGSTMEGTAVASDSPGLMWTWRVAR